MRACSIILIAFCMIIWGCWRPLASAPAAATEATRLTELPMEVIGAEFRALRALRGHFSGGTWDARIDQWMGRKHQLMQAIGARVADRQYNKSDITELLGVPDQVARQGDALFDLIASLPDYDASTAASYEFLVYDWRGRHDFLFFACQDNRVIRSGWWYAGE